MKTETAIKNLVDSANAAGVTDPKAIDAAVKKVADAANAGTKPTTKKPTAKKESAVKTTKPAAKTTTKIDKEPTFKGTKKTEAKPTAKVSGKSTAKKTERKPTVSSRARELILAGKTNEQVFKALQHEFKLGEKHKAYASWYRAQLVRIEKKTNGAKAAEALHLKLSKTAHAA